MPEYALLMFAVLISAAAVVKRIGPRVSIAGSESTALLLGADIEASNSGSAIGGLSIGATGSSSGESSTGSSGSAASSGGSSAVAAAVTGGAASGGSSTDFLGGASGGSASEATGGSGGGGGSSVGSNVAAVGGGILNGGGVVLGASGSQPASSGASSGSSSGGGSSASVASTAGETTDGLFASNQKSVTGGETTDGFFGSSAPANAKTAAVDEAPKGFIGGTNSPAFSHASSFGSQNTVNPPPSSASSASSEGATQGDGYTVSAAGEKQMQALLAQAKANADGKRPLGKCYHVVKTDIDEVGYGDLAKMGNTAFPKQIPGSDQEYAHQFADYMNAKGANGQTNASNLGLQKLPITNPYDAPAGSIIVVRAGTPGTRNPVAGDIVVAGGNGKFYNDGNMGYGGSKNFPKGNTYVLGIYAPK